MTFLEAHLPPKVSLLLPLKWVLGILLFGWNRVKPWVHLISTIGVFLGSMFSAVWIVVANSWQQTPAGYRIVGEGMNARAEITDFWAMVLIHQVSIG